MHWYIQYDIEGNSSLGMLILPVNPVASVIGPAYLSVFSKHQIVAAIVRLPTLETRKWGAQWEF